MNSPLKGECQWSDELSFFVHMKGALFDFHSGEKGPLRADGAYKFFKKSG